MSKPSWLYNDFYCTFMYKLANSSMYADYYVRVTGINKRHARKVLFRLLNKKYKKTMSHIRIENYPFLPMRFAEEYEYSSKFFWSDQDVLYGTENKLKIIAQTFAS